MATKKTRQENWEAQVKAVGFRETAIGFLRDRLYREYEKKRADRLIRRLSKYEPQQEIVKLLCQNPAWRQRAEELILELPEVTADPQTYFVFKGEGNVPKVPVLRRTDFTLVVARTSTESTPRQERSSGSCRTLGRDGQLPTFWNNLSM